MAKKGKTRSGGKFTGNHTTITDRAAPVIDFIAKLEEVTKISPGIINPLSSKGGNSIKILNKPGCLQIKVIGGGVQTFHIYSGDKERTIKNIQEKFPNRVRT